MEALIGGANFAPFLREEPITFDMHDPIYGYQDFFDPIWRQGWRAADLVQMGSGRVASVERESTADQLDGG